MRRSYCSIYLFGSYEETFQVTFRVYFYNKLDIGKSTYSNDGDNLHDPSSGLATLRSLETQSRRGVSQSVDRGLLWSSGGRGELTSRAKTAASP